MYREVDDDIDKAKQIRKQLDIFEIQNLSFKNMFLKWFAQDDYFFMSWMKICMYKYIIQCLCSLHWKCYKKLHRLRSGQEPGDSQDEFNLRQSPSLLACVIFSAIYRWYISRGQRQHS